MVLYLVWFAGCPAGSERLVKSVLDRLGREEKSSKIIDLIASSPFAKSSSKISLAAPRKADLPWLQNLLIACHLNLYLADRNEFTLEFLPYYCK